MICVTKMDGRKLCLNADWIQSVESTPDTVITLTTGFVLMVQDTQEAVTNAVVAYKRRVFQQSDQEGAE